MLGRGERLGLIDRVGLYVGPAYRDMAHSGLHSGYRLHIGRTASSVQSRLCVSCNSVADGRYGAGCLLHGYGLRDLTHDSEGQIIYGVAIGLLTVVIRTFGAYPEGMSFAILIMNAFTPLINTYCKPKRFGEVVKK